MSWVDLTFTRVSLSAWESLVVIGSLAGEKVDELALGGDSGLHPGSAWSPQTCPGGAELWEQG